MTDNQRKIQELQERMNLLISRQNKFIAELRELRDEIKVLQAEEGDYTPEPPRKTAPETAVPEKEPTVIPSAQPKEKPAVFVDFEKFIGENLISKLGILLVLIAVIIGARYSIENELISPLTRIVLGYLTGAGLLGFGIYLKRKYENYSAVLVSGSIAIMYFITYAAYSYYDLFPQLFAFVLMVLFTVFTVIAAVHYNRQIIAHIGLVGAYAVPFFLSSGSGDMLTFFAYITIINVGILAIAFRKDWKKLYYAAFAQTWLIFLAWYLFDYSDVGYFAVACAFSLVFFLLFYAVFMAYKLVKKENFDVPTVVVLLLNSFIFYGVGYSLLESHPTGLHFLGLFTAANAAVHLAVGAVIKQQKLYDKQLFYLIVGLVLVFVTMAIPVQLDGNWVTLLWATEAALLFWVGRTRGVLFYEKISYALMLLGFASIVQDWSESYNFALGMQDEMPLPFLNVRFLTTVIVTAAFGFINKIHHDKRYDLRFADKEKSGQVVTVGLAVLFFSTLFFGLYVEISAYFDKIYNAASTAVKYNDGTRESIKYNYDILKFKNVWLLNYTMLFLTVLGFVNLKKLKNEALGFAALVLSGLIIVAFITNGVGDLSRLHRIYFNPSESPFFPTHFGYIAVKYISYGFLAGLFYVVFTSIKTLFFKKIYRVIADILLHISLLTLISVEFLDWTNAAGFANSDSLILSIIWGVYALALIGLGIWKKQKHLRIAAIVLFGLTLFKLFFYDISHLNTIAKTIVLVSLGVLLLVISFLYTKYKDLIFGEDGEEAGTQRHGP